MIHADNSGSSRAGLVYTPLIRKAPMEIPDHTPMRLAALFVLAAAALAQTRAPAIETIRKEELQADLYFLASDALRGRLTASPEYQLAAEWIASRFARLGLQPLAEDASFFHRFDLVLSRLADGNRLVLNTAPDARRIARLHEDFSPLIFSADAEARGRVTFAGFGIHAPELNWDDYRGRNVAGQIVLLLEGDPERDDPKSRFDGLVTSEYANTLRKALAAQSLGATAVLFADPRATRPFAATARAYWPAKPPHLERYTLATHMDRVRIPALQVSPAIAEQILGRKLAEINPSAPLTSALPVELAAALHRTIVPDRSVVGRIEGADPQLKNEAVLISAHYDHNGGDGQQIFPGADDNGSGTVAVLDIAEAFLAAAQRGQRPRRTVLFAVWGSEERCCGPLLGSWAWVERPLWPLDKTIAALNMDMIGRSEEVPETGGPRFNGLKPQTAASNANSVHVMGYSFNPDLAAAVRAANRDLDLTLRLDYDNNKSNLLRRSDQWPFLQRRVPAVFFHTGLHPDYHTANDRPERIDYGKMERITRLVYQTAWDLAGSSTRPQMPPQREILDPR